MESSAIRMKGWFAQFLCSLFRSQERFTSFKCMVKGFTVKPLPSLNLTHINDHSRKYNRLRFDGISQTSSLSIWKKDTNNLHNNAWIYNDYSINHCYLWCSTHSLCQEMIKRGVWNAKSYISTVLYFPHHTVHITWSISYFT